MPTFLETLTSRGLVHDVTPDLAARLESGPITAYVGFDPTAASLQIGNLVPVMLLAHLQRAGGTPIVLVGGGTAMIGDPSGHDEERPLLTPAAIDANVERQRAQLSRFLDFTGDNAARMVDNADWLRPLKLVDFLRDTGKHFTIAFMLQKESVRSRMEAGISFTEFSYMLLQAYDFLHLYREHGCELQMGGSDQWGNITAGTELVRREGGQAHALSAPLITMASGAKFGKTAGGAVWLDGEMTTPYQFYQFWVNADDRDVASYLRIFTFLSLEEIDGLMRTHEADPGARIPQHRLAAELTTRIHGEAATARVAAASQIIFGGMDARTADRATWETLEAELPHHAITGARLPVALIDLAVESSLVASKGEARRQLQQGGIYLDGDRAAPDTTVGQEHLLAGQFIWLRRGKKTDVIVRVATDN